MHTATAYLIMTHWHATHAHGVHPHLPLHRHHLSWPVHSTLHGSVHHHAPILRWCPLLGELLLLLLLWVITGGRD